MEIYATLEISDGTGTPTGKYRRTVRSDDPVSGPFGLCRHEHDSIAEAEACPEAKAVWEQAFGQDVPTLRTHVERLKQKLRDAERELALATTEADTGP